MYTVGLEFIELVESGWSKPPIRLVASLVLPVRDGPDIALPVVVDTGAPMSCVPRSTWERLVMEPRGSVPLTIAGSVGLKPYGCVQAYIIGSVQRSERIAIPVCRADHDGDLGILGFQGMLSETSLFCDYRMRTAFLTFRSTPVRPAP